MKDWHEKLRSGIALVAVLLTTLCSGVGCSGSSGFDYLVRVEERTTSDCVQGAKVIIEVPQKVPLDETTDVNGIAVFAIDSSYADQRGRLIVEASGYQRYEQNINLVVAALPDVVQLEQELPPPPTQPPPTQPPPTQPPPTEPTLPPLCTVYRDEGECGSLEFSYEQGGIRLDYDVSGEGEETCFAVCAIDLRRDLSEYNTVAFRIKGAAGGEIAEVGLRDTQGNEPKIKVHDYLAAGIATDWQTVRIPLAAFTSISDWTGVQGFSIAFSKSAGSTRGTVFLANIGRFEQMVVPLVVDTFDDREDTNALRGGYGTFREGAADVQGRFDADNPFSGTGASYCLVYTDVTPSHYAAWETDLRGVDVSRYEALSLWIKEIDGNETPRLYLADEEDRRGVEVDATTLWQELRIPLLEYSGVDLQQLSKLQIAFEWEEMSGTICVDDIRFVEGSANALLAVAKEGWEPAGWDGDKATGITVASDGRLRGDFDGTQDPVPGDYKATFLTANLPSGDWTPYRSLKFDVENTLPSGKSLEVTIAVATGEESCWNESTMWTRLDPGPNHLTFRLDTPDYERCPDWDFGVIKERDYVRRLHLVFLLQEPLAGTVYIDNVRLEE